MNFLKRSGIAIVFFLMTLPAHSAMVSTPELMISPDQARLISSLQNEQIRSQLVEMGVDPVAATKRVKQMTSSEIASLQGKIDQLPAGAGVSTVDLLLIIIILILLL